LAEPAPTHDEADVDGRLSTFGLEATVLRDAIGAGEAERRTCTAFDPRILGGVMAWGRTIRALRERLVPNGWTSESFRGLEVVVSPDRRIAITVSTGDDRTGLRGPAPFTKYRRGFAFQEAMRNGLQLPLPGFEQPTREDEPENLWVLLISRGAEEIRCELSQPNVIGPDRRVGFVGERIILRPIPTDTTALIGNEDDGDEPDLDVPIERI
jgi:hypothetical protein